MNITATLSISKSKWPKSEEDRLKGLSFLWIEMMLKCCAPPFGMAWIWILCRGLYPTNLSNAASPNMLQLQLRL